MRSRGSVDIISLAMQVRMKSWPSCGVGSSAMRSRLPSWCSDLGAVETLCAIEPAERELLASSRRPIVLLRKRIHIPIANEVAPNNPYLGIMLPHTPIHHLLMSELDGMPLVMTSGNRSDEPIAYDDSDALRRLAGIADVFLVHNRPIHVRCDDTVTRCVDGIELPIRRSRGDAPLPISLPFGLPKTVLAVGGQFKGTFAFGRRRHAILSHHLGDLDHFEAFQAFQRDIDLYEQLFSIRPEIVAHDLHPDYASTRYAQSRGGVSLVAIQHHHAHLASCMAEHGLDEPAIGVIFDGTGYGTDGMIWGGEFLVGEYRQFARAAHFRYVGLPGSHQAIHEPWRLALSHGLDSGLTPDFLAKRIPSSALRTVSTMLERRVNCPMTSSAGRLFDAIASIAGVRDKVSYEGQAAIELEWLATDVKPDGTYPFELDNHEGTTVIDTRPLIRRRRQRRGARNRCATNRSALSLDDGGNRKSGLQNYSLGDGIWYGGGQRGRVHERTADTRSHFSP